jgi:hypothetical protein
LWGMTPPAIGAAWTESMQLGAALHDEGREEYCRELESKNLALGRDLGVSQLQLHIAREDLEKVRACKRALESQLEDTARELQEANVELSLLKREREERLEQERLAVEIWGPRTRTQPDATWDPAPVLLTAEDPPITVRGVAAELGFKLSRRDLQDVGSHVRDAFMRAHGRVPELRVFHGKDGAADRIGCFTERDRKLITAVVLARGRREEGGAAE